MPSLPPCHLTSKGLTILETILKRARHRDEAFLRLLRRKLSAARVVFRDDIDPRVATVNSRVDFVVDGGPEDSRILVHGRDNVFPGVTLPITTLRGLALLGLEEGQAIVVERPDGDSEEVRLARVVYQPEAARKARSAWTSPVAPARARDEPSTVVAFAPRRSLSSAPQPDDDDPGPRAA